MRPVDLDRVIRHARRIQRTPPSDEGVRRELHLLKRIRRRRPAVLGARYRLLLRKLEAESLTESERRELMPLIDMSEALMVERLQALTELAHLRQTTVSDLMLDLGLRKPRG